MTVLVGCTVPNQAFNTGSYYAGQTQTFGDADFIANTGVPTGRSTPTVTKKFWNPSNWKLSSNFNNLAAYRAAGTHVVMCPKPAFDAGVSLPWPSGGSNPWVQDLAALGTWLAGLAAMGFNGSNCSIALWQEPSNNANAMLASDYANMWAYYGPTITGAGFSSMISVNYAGTFAGYSNHADNAVEYARAAIATGVTFAHGIGLDYYTNHYFATPPVLLDTLGTSGFSLASLADANGLAYSLNEFGSAPLSFSMPQCLQYQGYLLSFFTGRILAGKPPLWLIWYDGQGSPSGSGDITAPLLSPTERASFGLSGSDPRITAGPLPSAGYFEVYNGLTAVTPPPPPPPPPPPGPQTVSYGPPSALLALLSAADTALSPWPAPTARQYVALDPNAGSALMPNPTTIPSTLLLTGSPPLQLPSGTAGWVLVSDNSGNLTLQAPTAAGVSSVTAGDASIAVGGAGSAPTLETGTLDQIASLHPAAANWSNNSHKITNLAPATNPADAPQFSQSPPPGWTAADNGWLIVNGDYGAASAGNALTAGTLYLQRLITRAAMTISDLTWLVNTIGAGASSGTFAGLYSVSGSTGTLLTGSSDVGSLFTATGPAMCPLTTPQGLGAGTVLYAALLVNLASTQPGIVRFINTGTVANPGLNAGSSPYFRWAQQNSIGTSLPSTVNLSSNATTSNTLFVAGS